MCQVSIKSNLCLQVIQIFKKNLHQIWSLWLWLQGEAYAEKKKTIIIFPSIKKFHTAVEEISLSTYTSTQKI